MILKEAKTDWLGSKPVFYNEKTGKISYSIGDVIDYDNFEFHPEGLHNYLTYGYSVFGQTPLQDVKFLRYASSIKNINGKLIIDEQTDPCEKLIGQVSKPDEVLSNIQAVVKEWGGKQSKIILPLSGGYDSRILLSLIPDKEIVRAYTYGYSVRQYDSYECIKAKKVAEICGVDWENIRLGNYLQYIDEWDNLFGAAVHSHGMYQMEFYKKILLNGINKGAGLLSGIIGDAWAGNVRISHINNYEELLKLGYSHGFCIDEDVCLLPRENEIKRSFFEKNREKLKEENWRIIYAMRLKIMLLRYLVEVPKQYGLVPYAPFLDINIALSMLNLPWGDKENRQWQKKYFMEESMEWGWLKRECDYNMVLEEEALRRAKLQPLNIELLSDYIKRDYLEWINKHIVKVPIQSFSARPKTLLNIINKSVKRSNITILKALTAYKVLYPLDRILLKKEGKKEK